MYKCKICNKQFQYESEFNRHKNRKTNCNIDNLNFECNICNLKFTRHFDKIRHENTLKHINNIKQLYNNNQSENNEFQTIINKLNNKIIDLESINVDLNNKISNMENEINILNKSNQLLKNNQKVHIVKEYIYIIHCAQHINENIYKIGRTKNISKRLKQYPNGSELLFTTTCNNSKLIENEIIHYLKNDSNYIHHKESGNEYFKCELENLKLDIQNIINK